MATGEVRIDVRASVDKLGDDISRASKALDRLTATFDKQVASIKKQEAAIEAMNRQLQAIVTAEKAPASLIAMEAQLKRINAEIAKQQAEYDAVVSKIKDVNNSLEIAKSLGRAEDIEKERAALALLDDESLKYADALETARDKADLLSARIAEIKLDPATSAEALALRDKISLATETLDATKTKANETKNAIQELMSQPDRGTIANTEKLGNVADKSNLFFKKLGSTIKGIIASAAGMLTLGKHTKTAGDHARHAASGFGKMFDRIKNLVLAAFVFNVISRGLNELQKYIGGLLQTNAEFVASVNTIKVNLMTAFQPIYEAILPAINALASALATVTGYLAAFIAMLGGKTYAQAKDATKALNQQAAALKGVGGAAKKAGAGLQGFDEINLAMQDTATGGAGASDDIASMFDAVEEPIIDYTWLDDIIEKIRQIGEVFKLAWDETGLEFLEALRRSLNNIWDLIKIIGQTWFDVWTGGRGQELVESFIRLMTTLLSIIGDIAKAFRDSWKEMDRGKRLIESIFDLLTMFLNILNDIGIAFKTAWNENERGKEMISTLMEMFISVNELILTIGRAFREAWSDYGVSIWANILEIITNVAITIGSLSDRLREAWETNDNGVRIWGAILGIIDSVLGAINEMTAITAVWTENLNLVPIVSGFTNLLEAIKPVVEILLDGLAWAYENVLLPFDKWLIELVVPEALNILANIFDILKNTLEALKPYALSIWNDFLKPLGEWTGQKIIDALEKINKSLEKFSNWIKDNPEKIRDLTNVITLLGVSFASASLIMVGFPALITSIGTAIGMTTGTITAGSLATTLFSSGLSALGGIFTFLVSPIGILTALIATFVYTIATIPEEMERAKERLSRILDNIKKIFEETIDLIKIIVSDFLDMLKNAWEERLENVVIGVGKAVNDIFEWFSKLFDEFLEPIITKALVWLLTIWNESLSNVVKSVLDFVATVGENLVYLWEKVIKPVFDFLMEYVVPIVKESFLTIIDIFFESVNTIMGILDGLIKILFGLIDFIVGIFTGNWQKAWSGIVKIFEGIITSIIAIIKGVANTVIDITNGMIRSIFTGINSVINAVNRLKIPGIDIGVNIPTLTPPQIPRLAKGLDYVPYDEFPAILHKGERILTAEENIAYSNPAIATALDNFTIAPQVMTILSENGAKQSRQQEISDSSLMKLVNMMSESIAIMLASLVTETAEDKKFVININGREFVRATMNDFLDESSRMGISIVKS